MKKEEILEIIYKADPLYIGCSYRQKAETGYHLFMEFIYSLKESGLLIRENGKSRKIAFAGLPATIELLSKGSSKLTSDVSYFRQSGDSEKDCRQLLRFFEIKEQHIDEYLKFKRTKEGKNRIDILDQIADHILKEIDHRQYGSLPVPDIAAREDLFVRGSQSSYPLLRSHFGVNSETIEPTVEGIKILAKAGALDEISLGSSDLSQRYFSKPEEFEDRKNDGGVPYKDKKDLQRLYMATRTGNFPAIKPYAHVNGMIDFIDTCLETGMLTGGHQAIPLFWFNELDGRGETELKASISEHLDAIKKLGSKGIPVEINDPNQWSSRWAQDALIVADYAINSSIMINSGVQSQIYQMQFNKPRETSDTADLAKMNAAREIIEEMIMKSGINIKHLLQTRTGIGYFVPDQEIARWQLVRSTLLQLLVDPGMLHVVSYCEAERIATPADIIESSQLVRAAYDQFKKYEIEIRQEVDKCEYKIRKDRLKQEAGKILNAVSGKQAEKFDPKTMVNMTCSGVLFEAVQKKIISAPGILLPEYKSPNWYFTGISETGGVDCFDTKNGNVIAETERLSRLGN
ncbi:MAG: hypothetical protein K9J13_07555 [Saprospiraceae bacterium]|nr:hypothetical protein [Saprospiraceae bacterium]